MRARKNSAATKFLIIMSAMWLPLIPLPLLADHGGGSHIDWGLSVPTTSTGSYTVTWTSAPSGTTYLQEKLNSGSYFTVTADYNGGPGSYPTTNTDGTWTYRQYNRICFYSCTTLYSYPVSVVVSSSPPPGNPGPIQGPSSVDDTGGGARYLLSWTASTGTVSHYELQRSFNGGGWSTIQSTGDLTRQETGRTQGTHSYRVRACDGGNCSAYTASKAVSVSSADYTSTRRVIFIHTDLLGTPAAETDESGASND